MKVDDFESYTSDEDLAKSWIHPNHGGWIRQTLDKTVKHSGTQCLKVEFRTLKEPKKFYCPICINRSWDLSGSNAFQFWLKPDGSGRELGVELNCANAAGKNIHDLWGSTYKPVRGDAAWRRVVVPFAQFVHNLEYVDSADWSLVFKPEAVNEVAFYIGGGNETSFGDGIYYFDELEGVEI